MLASPLQQFHVLGKVENFDLGLPGRELFDEVFLKGHLSREDNRGLGQLHDLLRSRRKIVRVVGWRNDTANLKGVSREATHNLLIRRNRNIHRRPSTVGIAGITAANHEKTYRPDNWQKEGFKNPFVISTTSPQLMQIFCIKQSSVRLFAPDLPQIFVAANIQCVVG